MTNPIDDFKTAMQSAGLTPPDHIEPGKIQCIPGADKGRSNKAGRCFMFPDERGGWFMDYANGGEQINWQATGSKPYTEAERQANIERSKAAKAAYEAEKAKAQADAATEAEKRFKAGINCTTHPYLTARHVQAHGGLKVEADGTLLVPMRDENKKLWNVERINPLDFKDKRGLPGGKRKGLYHVIGGKPTDTLLIASGYATAASCFEATGITTVVSFNDSNIPAIAGLMRCIFDDLKIVICGDDDVHNAINSGVKYATEAATAIGGYLALPDFGQARPDGATDFNDLHQISGLAAVKHCIDAAVLVTPTASEATASGFQKSSVVLTCGSNLQPEPVQWLWPDWLALGKFHLLAGAPGQGKTTIAMGLAATITIGGRWPDGSRCAPGNALIWSGEDDYRDTLLPRLIASGADRSRVYFVDGTRVGTDVRPFDPASDTVIMKEAIEKIGSVSLIVVDPVSTAVSGDSHKNTEVRRGLQPLVDLAASVNAALLGITHLSKGGQGTDPAQRVIGSIAFTAVARVVLVAAKVQSEDGTDKRILARGKSNIGPDDGGFEYHLAQVEALRGIQASRVEWGQAVEGTARELLTDPTDDAGNDHEDAASLLRAELADGMVSADQASKPLKDAGFSKKQIWAASKKLNVIRKKGGMGGGWYWRLPGSDSVTDVAFRCSAEDSNSPEDSEGSPFSKQESSEPSVESSVFLGQVESSGTDFAEITI